MKKQVILTGDRPTGRLHLGHYIGSLMNRVTLQHEHTQYVMIADVQALTDNFEHPEKVKQNILEVICDYLAVGIDPQQTTIFLQSMIPAIAELTIFYMNLVTVARLERNPTVKNEIRQKNIEKSLPVGFFVYPISQAADITCVKATLVPVGEDQIPMIEQTNEIVRSFNRIYNTHALMEATALVPKYARLSGTDGQAKMSKSMNNAIYLSDTQDELAKKVKSMYTDPLHVRIEDPGRIEGNTVFEYLDAFATDADYVQRLKEQYQQGGLGDMKVKGYLLEVLEQLLGPIRERRKQFEKQPEEMLKILFAGTEKVNEIADRTLQEVKDAMKLYR